MNSRENAKLDLSHIHTVVNPNKLHYYLKIMNYDRDETERLIAGFKEQIFHWLSRTPDQEK